MFYFLYIYVYSFVPSAIYDAVRIGLMRNSNLDLT